MLTFKHDPCAAFADMSGDVLTRCHVGVLCIMLSCRRVDTLLSGWFAGPTCCQAVTLTCCHADVLTRVTLTCDTLLR